ncbi:hypothetical protein [Ectothiorhodospira shaposhnikovii]|uniref:hypothetical protein n=1 Tax=Ectothiorhodospira shaposhnikovii TaxID=1054 RepID=UPI001EE8A5D7|nr:hypothetical protein [Ectothiorhodospira shaposhnikovii]MCG5512726.1 hypothetical protein [Ectothiorhodospira shaposhnikovii]
MQDRHRLLLPILLALGLSALAPACSLLPEQITQSTLEVETIDSTDYRFGPVRVMQYEQGLQVRGTIAHDIHRRGAIPGTIHIEVLAQDGHLLAEADAYPMRKNRQAYSARFGTWLPVAPEAGQRIRLSHQP